MHATPWLIRLPGGPRAMQLFCFPCAGGAASGFLRWQSLLPPNIDGCAVQLPGRGARLCEAPLDDMATLIEALVVVIREHARAPFAFFGHSLGGLLAYELARRCRRLGLPLPQHLFVSASIAPPDRVAPRPLHLLGDHALIDALRDYNGTPPEALAHRELMELMLPAIRADFALLAGYRYEAEPPLPIPISVLAGTRDKHVTADQLAGWQDCTTLPCRQHWFEGDHFFPQAQAEAVIECLKAELIASRPSRWTGP